MDKKAVSFWGRLFFWFGNDLDYTLFLDKNTTTHKHKEYAQIILEKAKETLK